MKHETKVNLLYYCAYLLMVGLCALAVFSRFQRWTLDWSQFNH